MVSPWIPGLTGGLAGAVFTLLGQWLCRHCKRPKLEIVFENAKDGCRVPTDAWLADRRTGNKLTDSNGNPIVVKQVYLRLRIENRGKTFAKNTSVCVTQIDYHRQGAPRTAFAEEVLDLKLALTGDRAVFNLASGGHRFVDLVYTYQAPGQAAELAFAFMEKPSRLDLVGFGKGQYKLNVFATAENAKSEPKDVEFSWDGTLDGLIVA